MSLTAGGSVAKWVTLQAVLCAGALTAAAQAPVPARAPGANTPGNVLKDRPDAVFTDPSLDDFIDDHWDRVEGGFGLPDPLTRKRPDGDPNRAALVSSIRDFYRAADDLLVYRFAANGARWAREGAKRKAGDLEEKLDGVRSRLPELDSADEAWRASPAGLSFDGRLRMIARLLASLQPKLHQVVSAWEVVDIALLRRIDDDLRSIQVIAGALAR